MATLTRNRADDGGLGLIELIVGMVVAGLVVLTAASVLVNSWLTQADVTSTTNATNRGQLIGSSIERAMRNAKDFIVAPLDAAGTELRVWTTLGADKTCQGFQLASGMARFTTSTGMLPAVSNWPLWDDGIAQHGTAAFFVKSGKTVTYTFEITTDSAPVQISGEAAMRWTPTGDVSPCW